MERKKVVFLKVNDTKLNDTDELAIQIDRVGRKLSLRYGFNPRIYKHKFGLLNDDFVKARFSVKLTLMK
jgi:hypothetical protein